MGIITGPYAWTTTMDCGIRIWNAPVRLPSSTKSWRLARGPKGFWVTLDGGFYEST